MLVDGPEDRACHASKGRTERTEVMFGEAGRFYVYLCYGMYFMLNIVTGKKDYPAAILIRGAEVIDGPAPLEIARARSVKALMGPGKLTKALKIDKKLNDKSVSRRTGLWLEDRGFDLKSAGWRIKRTPRIGVQYAGQWAKKPYRFLLKK